MSVSIHLFLSELNLKETLLLALDVSVLSHDWTRFKHWYLAFTTLGNLLANWTFNIGLSLLLRGYKMLYFGIFFIIAIMYMCIIAAAVTAHFILKYIRLGPSSPERSRQQPWLTTDAVTTSVFGTIITHQHVHIVCVTVLYNYSPKPLK